MFSDPVFDGAADPSLVWHGPEKAWYVFYTQRRANQDLPGVSWAFGTEIDANDRNKPDIKRSVLQMAELGLRDGKMTCDRDK